MPIVVKQRVRFGPLELDTRARELYKRGLKLKLQGHPIDVLAMLLERPGDLITREEIQQKRLDAVPWAKYCKPSSISSMA